MGSNFFETPCVGPANFKMFFNQPVIAVPLHIFFIYLTRQFQLKTEKLNGYKSIYQNATIRNILLEFGVL